MATDYSRRHLLRAGGMVSAMVLAGCSDGGPVEQNPETTETTTSPKEEVSTPTETSSERPTITPSAKLIPSGGRSEDRFGYSLALANDTALIGSIWDRNTHGAVTGSTYIFTPSTSEWSQQIQLRPTDSEEGRFGSAIALDEDTALIGDPMNEVPTGSGAVYVFRRDEGEWTHQAKLFVEDDNTVTSFGFSVALEGDTALIGAETTEGGRGSAHVFRHSDGTWFEENKIAPDTDRQRFGRSVALSGDTALIHDGWKQGSVYVYRRSDDGWSHQTTLSPAGEAIALEQVTAVVGAASNPDALAHVFERSDGAWNQQADIVASSDEQGDTSTAASIALLNDTILLGDPGQPDSRGSSYLFRREQERWTQQASLVAEDSTAGDIFGSSVALANRTALVGAEGAEDSRGSVYVFNW